jgi:Cu/Ag efflux protein CusF
MMRKSVWRSLAFAVAVMAVTLPWTAHAGDEKKAAKKGEQYFDGTISAIDFKARSVTVSEKAGGMTFTCNDGTRFYAKQKKEGAKLDDFKVGDKVEVLYVVADGTPTVNRLAEKGAHADKKEKREEKQK